MNYVFVCYVITFLTTAVFNSRLTGYPGTEQRAVAPGHPLPLAFLHSLPSRELASTLVPSIQISVTLQDHIMSPPVPSFTLRIHCRRLPWAAKVSRARPISTWSAHGLRTSSTAPAAWAASLRRPPAGSLSVISILNTSAQETP